MIRISGPQSARIAETLTGNKRWEPRQAHLCRFRDAAGEIIDQGLALWFPGPASYTGEDLLELHGHGGLAAPALLLERVLGLGARPARPGEFTERAFHNNKLDLAQAEAVADLIGSQTGAAARSALRSLEGGFSRRIAALRAELIEIRKVLEALLDFPEEGDWSEPGENITQRLQSLSERVSETDKEARYAELLSQGLELAIVGPPNTGKSTLMNSLCGRELAIVSPQSGTTRDLICATIDVDGVPVRLTDTAGLHTSSDEIEQEGMRRAGQAMEQADLILLVQENESPLPAWPDELADRDQREVVRVLNKIDRCGRSAELCRDESGITLYLSARTGDGLDLLRRLIHEQVGGSAATEGGTMSARRRHLHALLRVQSCLRRGIQVWKERQATELLAEELSQAQKALGEISGEYTSEELLGEIFSSFCIGK